MPYDIAREEQLKSRLIYIIMMLKLENQQGTKQMVYINIWQECDYLVSLDTCWQGLQFRYLGFFTHASESVGLCKAVDSGHITQHNSQTVFRAKLFWQVSTVGGNPGNLIYTVVTVNNLNRWSSPCVCWIRNGQNRHPSRTLQRVLRWGIQAEFAGLNIGSERDADRVWLYVLCFPANRKVNFHLATRR